MPFADDVTRFLCAALGFNHSPRFQGGCVGSWKEPQVQQSRRLAVSEVMALHDDSRVDVGGMS
jgi:hypothetical protein